MSAHLSVDQVSGWALHALDPEEHASCEAHLHSCPECRAAVAAEGEVVAAALAAAFPVVVAPDELRRRVLQGSSRRRGFSWGWAAAAALLLGWLAREQVWSGRLSDARRQLAEARQSETQWQSQARAVGWLQPRFRSLPARGSAAGKFRLLQDPDTHRLLIVGDTGSLREGVYQVWLIHDGKPLSRGVLAGQQAPRASVEGPFAAGDALAVTWEKEESAQPGSAPILVSDPLVQK